MQNQKVLIKKNKLKMKKNVFKIVIASLIIIGGLVFYSCQTDKKNEIEKPNKSSITAKSMEFVGIEHNQLLEESFQFLKKEHRKNSYVARTIDNRKQRLEDFLISRVESNNKYSKESNELAVANIKKAFSSESTIASRVSISNASRVSISNESTIDFPEEIKGYLEDLDKILDQIGSNTDVGEKISNLEKRIEMDNKLTEKNLIILFSATQTAKYSYAYWSKNADKWKFLSKEGTLRAIRRSADSGSEQGNSNSNSGWETTKDIVKYDVAGAAGGAAGAAIVNVIPVAGQVAYGSAIVGGAVGASVTEGVKKLLDWMI